MVTMLEDAATRYGAVDGVVTVSRRVWGGELVVALPADRHAEIALHAHTPPEIPVEIPVGQAVGVSVPVFVNHGRWLVQCPTCRSAQWASKTDHRFFCVECCNEAHGGLWITVKWPGNAAKIEAALLKRPDPNTRGWMPGETIADLTAQNEQHGVA